MQRGMPPPSGRGAADTSETDLDMNAKGELCGIQ